jgi:putative ABC transport system permease protein
MNPAKLALRMLWRDGRSGELTILALALLIAVTSSTSITLFASRLQATMTDQAAEFLAADLVITSHADLPEAWLKKSAEFQLNQAQTAEFTSVLMEHDEILLAGIKSVSQAYPLRGHLKSSTTDYLSEHIEAHGPSAGEAWVEKRVLSALKLKLGEPLTVGEKALTVSKIITYEPDKRGDLYSLAPRVMINNQDLAATNVLQPGSHVHYAHQFSGDPTKINQFKQWVKPQLNLAQRIMDVHEDRPELGSALERAERYLGLSSIVVIIISGVAIAMATRRYTERHLDSTAIMRCLGCRQNTVLYLFLGQFIILGLLVSSLGCGFGWLLQEFLFTMLKNLLPQTLGQPSVLALFMGLLTGITVLLGFALPPLLQLRQVTPVRVLRRDLAPLAASGWLVYGIATGLIVTLIWRYTNDLKMTATLFSVGLAVLLGLGLLTRGSLLLARGLLPHMNLNWRFGLQSLLRNNQATTSQILAFTITLVAMALTFVVRNDLLDTWQKQLPDQAPNHFALNLFSDQLPTLQSQMQAQGIKSNAFFPVVRGRLIEINNTPVQQLVSKDTQGESATHRELSLTSTTELPEENTVIKGSWWSEQPQPNQVSVEQKLAESLKIGLGDQLLFVIGGQKLSATVSSIRALRWDTMKPNFYLIFSPNTLAAYPTTYITSFYLPASKKNYLNQLVKSFPAVTILEVDQILQQFKTLLKQLTAAINYVLYFALMAGFTVLFSAIYATLDNRIYESALLRTFGAGRGLLRLTHLIEFGLIGLFSGLLAIIVTEIMLYALYSRVLHITYQPVWQLWVTLPLLSMLAVSLVGSWAVRKVVSVPPIQVLRDS